jgi:hypothetical protein
MSENPILINSIKSGLTSGFKCCWILIKVIIPVYFFITALKYSPAMDWLSSAFTPLMGALRLPGEAALPIITGFLLDEYGIIAAIKAVELTGYSITVVITMTFISHSLVVEAAILRKLGLNAVFFTMYRLTASVIMGFLLSIIGTAVGVW